VYYAAEAARIARDACEGTDELQKSKSCDLESAAVVVVAAVV
jgi:hypothetical protein